MHEQLPPAGATEIPSILIIGGILLAGWLAHAAGQRLRAPRVTLLLIIGMLSGPSALNLIPQGVEEWFPEVSNIALAMIGFLLGERFAGRDIKGSSRVVLLVSIGETLGAAIVLFALAMLAGIPVPLALLLAAIAPASDPVATFDVMKEGGAQGPLTSTVKGVVAIDDAWGVILFSLLLVVAEGMSGAGFMGDELLTGLWEVGGATLLGVAMGIPMAYLSGRIKAGEPTLIEAAAFVLLCGGLALLIHVSYLLACMVMGATVANRAAHYSRPFHAIEGASEPFLVMFFLLAGYGADFSTIKSLGFLGVVYIVGRSIGLVAGGNLSAKMADAPEVVAKHVGWCLLPQAGVAIGLSLLVADRMPQYGDQVKALILATTIFFEITAPLLTWYHLRKAGEFRAKGLS